MQQTEGRLLNVSIPSPSAKVGASNEVTGNSLLEAGSEAGSGQNGRGLGLLFQWHFGFVFRASKARQ